MKQLVQSKLYRTQILGQLTVCLEGVAEQVFYNEEFLKEGGTSAQYFQAISYAVELEDLYKIRDTCYYHQAMEYCPVLVEIIDKRLKEHYGGNYLLQVWDKSGKKVFERVLHYKVRSWNIFTDHFAFALDRNEAGAEWFYIYNLIKPDSVYKIKDFVQDLSYRYLGVANKCFYIASSQTIKIIVIGDDIQQGQQRTIEPTANDILTYDEIGDQCTIHGFFENQQSKEGNHIMCIIETTDSQIDFVRMYFDSLDVKKKDGIVFEQYTEVLHRDTKLDDIKQFKQIIHKDQQQFGVALRNSGEVDFYWNCKRVSSPKELFSQIQINFDTIYLVKAKDQTIIEIDTRWGARIGLEVSDSFKGQQKDWDKLFYQIIKNNTLLFPSYCLINTSFFLAHGNIISCFDIIAEEWVKHFFFEEKVVKVFKNEKNEKKYNLGAYLGNGMMKLIDSDDTDNPNAWNIKSNDYTTQGTLISMAGDLENYRMMYILTEEEESQEENRFKLYGFTRDTLYDLTTLVEELKHTTIILPFFSPEDTTEFILFNKEEGDLRIYYHYWAPNEEDVNTFYLNIKDYYKIEAHDEIKGVVHTAFSQTRDDHIFLCDNINLYKYSIKSQSLMTFQNQDIASLTLLDNNFMYALVNKNYEKKNTAGFYIYDIQQILNSNSVHRYHLDNAIVGINYTLDFSEDNQRMSYLVDYEGIQIVPSLHRNVINFMGMIDRDQYIACKRIKDKFIALDRRNILTTWSVTTGKLVRFHKLKDIDLSTYNIFQYDENDICYKMDWYQPKCLLIQRDALENMTDDHYYDAQMLNTSLKNNTPYIKLESKKFHNFKLIEIVNEFEVKEHFTFIHPFYGSYQRIYISENMEYMFERIHNQRVFLYQKLKGLFGSCKWKCVKRLQQWPTDLSEHTQANYLVSPDLLYYIDYDRKGSRFLIKETMTQKVHAEMPKGLMAPTEDNVTQYVKRIKWLNSGTIQLINNEGIEKIVDVNNGFQEIAFSAVPNFDPDEQYDHYYYHPRPLEIGDTLQRLKEKYAQFKSNYFLLKKTHAYQIYDDLFNVDFSINNCKSRYVASLSFTYLNWRLAEDMKRSKDFDLTLIDNQLVELLCYNIFPQCNHLLHYIYKNQQQIKDLYACSEKKGEEFEIPFFKNLANESPLHLCIKNNELKTADFMLQKLGKSKLDHHGRVIVDLIPLAIEQGLPSVGQYIDDRLIQTNQTKTINRGCLKRKRKLPYVCMESRLWEDEAIIQQQLFVKNSAVEREIKLEFLDLPTLHCYGNTAADMFFDVLAESDDVSLFGRRGIQTIIDFKWSLTKEFTIKRLFIPFIFYQISFFLYSNVVFVWQINEGSTTFQNVLDYIIGSVLLIFSIYFLVTEMRQLILSGFDYLLSVWNYLDIVPPILVPIIVIQDFLEVKYNFQNSMIALCSLCMWFKFLYFLRIFKQTGYLIRMITEVIKDMKIFIFVLLIVIIGFADAFMSLSIPSEEDAEFAGKTFFAAMMYSYRTALGDFQVDQYKDSVQPIMAWLLFLFSTLLVLIVMLNLLIAIISDSFSKINRVSQQYSYQERARMIAENSYLISSNRIDDFKEKGKYLLVAREIDTVGKEAEDQALNAIDDLKKEIQSLRTSIEQSFELKMQKILEEIKTSNIQKSQVDQD